MILNHDEYLTWSLLHRDSTPLASCDLCTKCILWDMAVYITTMWYCVIVIEEVSRLLQANTAINWLGWWFRQRNSAWLLTWYTSNYSKKTTWDYIKVLYFWFTDYKGWILSFVKCCTSHLAFNKLVWRMFKYQLECAAAGPMDQWFWHWNFIWPPALCSASMKSTSSDTLLDWCYSIVMRGEGNV